MDNEGFFATTHRLYQHDAESFWATVCRKTKNQGLYSESKWSCPTTRMVRKSLVSQCFELPWFWILFDLSIPRLPFISVKPFSKFGEIQSITAALDIPVIGIGASVECDGQVLVLYDILDISFGMRPKFSKNFMESSGSIGEAIAQYTSAVKNKTFPAAEHTFS